MALSKLMLLVQPTAFFETMGMGSIVAEAETPLAIPNFITKSPMFAILGFAFSSVSYVIYYNDTN